METLGRTKKNAQAAAAIFSGGEASSSSSISLGSGTSGWIIGGGPKYGHIVARRVRGIHRSQIRLRRCVWSIIMNASNTAALAT